MKPYFLTVAEFREYQEVMMMLQRHPEVAHFDLDRAERSLLDSFSRRKMRDVHAETE